MAFRFAQGFSAFVCSLALTLLAAPAHAQKSTPDLRPGNFEWGVYGGASHGVDSFRWMVGTNLSYSLPKLLLPYAEFTYMPGIRRQATTTQGASQIDYSSDVYDVHAGVHIRIIPHETRYVPYGVIGFGALHSDTSFTTTPIGHPEAANTSHTTTTDPAINFGGGFRTYLTSAWGTRLEFKFYRPLSGPFTNWIPKIEGGIFVQFGSH